MTATKILYLYQPPVMSDKIDFFLPDYRGNSGLAENGPTPQVFNPNFYYYRPYTLETSWDTHKLLGLVLFALGSGGLLAAVLPFMQLEWNYKFSQIKGVFAATTSQTKQTDTKEVKPELNVLFTPDGQPITPVDKHFSLIIPKIGVNAPVIAGVNPADPGGYTEALKNGVAHSSTSFYPDENGTVFLFSHSTNYEWFVKDLNAVFYLIKNLEAGDYVILMYLGDRYTYKIRGKEIVPKSAVSYLTPQVGERNLILQACWPPGTAEKRMLLFADLVEEKKYSKFGDLN